MRSANLLEVTSNGILSILHIHRNAKLLLDQCCRKFIARLVVNCIGGPGSSVGIATGYGLDGPG
jgi:hypothetical protein